MLETGGGKITWRKLNKRKQKMEEAKKIREETIEQTTEN